MKYSQANHGASVLNANMLYIIQISLGRDHGVMNVVYLVKYQHGAFALIEGVVT